MKPSNTAVIKAGLLKAMGRTWTIGFLAVGLGIACLANSWWLVLVGVASFVIMAAVQLRSVTFWRSVVSEIRRRPVELPAELEIADETARGFLIRLEKVRCERDRALACSPESPSEAALGLLETAGEAEEQALALIRARDRLGRFVSRRQPSRPLLPTSLPEGDPDREWSVRMLAEHAALGEDLAAMKARLDARLVALIDTLAVLPARLAALGVGDQPDVAGSADRDLRERLAGELGMLADPASHEERL
jgi:hypothetical protein